MSLFSKDVGIDLGTANTLVYMKGKGIIMREPSVVAVDTKSDEVRCVGAEAKAVIGRTPGSIVAVRPLKDGVIADFDITANMLENFLKKACGNSMFSRPRVVICIPSGVTEVERRAVREATLKAGARQVSVIEEPMAAAIGAGLPISEPTGSMIVDIGGGTAEIAVISLGGIVASRSVRMAGDMFDQAIIAFIKRKYNLLIGERTAEQIKIEIGSAYPMDPEMTLEIKGRNLVDGLPKNVVVHSEDVREALLECLGAQAIWGVIIIFLAPRRGLSSRIGSVDTTSTAAPLTFPLSSASLKSFSTIRGPLEVLMIFTPSFIFAMESLLMIPSVDGNSGQCRLMTSA